LDLEEDVARRKKAKKGRSDSYIPSEDTCPRCLRGVAVVVVCSRMDGSATYISNDACRHCAFRFFVRIERKRRLYTILDEDENKP
jgi:hypothetical protein